MRIFLSYEDQFGNFVQYQTKNNMADAIRTNALNDASNSINNMIQQQQINTNQYNSTFGY